MTVELFLWDLIHSGWNVQYFSREGLHELPCQSQVFFEYIPGMNKGLVSMLCSLIATWPLKKNLMEWSSITDVDAHVETSCYEIYFRWFLFQVFQTRGPQRTDNADQEI